MFSKIFEILEKKLKHVRGINVTEHVQQVSIGSENWKHLNPSLKHHKIVVFSKNILNFGKKVKKAFDVLM